MDSSIVVERAYCRYRTKNFTWTIGEIYLLCETWWVHSPHITEKGICFMYREACHEKDISLKGRSDGAILKKICDCYDIFVNGNSQHCSKLHNKVFNEIKKRYNNK